MSSTEYQIRRATVDDLPALLELWERMDFTAAGLDQRLTEFQVATDGAEQLLGAVAFETAGQQGRIHHEAFDDFALADTLRSLLWGRIQMLAQNHGVFRIWTQEDAPFWKQAGLEPAPRPVLQKLPAKWTNAQGGWLTLQLKEEAAIQALSSDQEFAAAIQAERERIAGRVQRFKMVAFGFAVLIAVLVGVLLLYLFSRNPGMFEHLGGALQR